MSVSTRAQSARRYLQKILGADTPSADTPSANMRVSTRTRIASRKRRKILDAETPSADIPSADTPSTDTPSAAARVLAVPELLEMIILNVDSHTKGPFITSNIAGTMQLCRLEKVNCAFRDTLRNSPKLKLSKQDVQLSAYPSAHAAMVWLLRELGHSGFSQATCEQENAGCRPGLRQPRHKCNGSDIQLEHSPSYYTSADRKRRFKKAVKEDSSWKSIRITRPLLIYFKDRSQRYCRIYSAQSTLGELWRAHADEL